ncbi:M15 family metallopeptidase [Nannocystis sp. SCPEA4]|uniref:M15 family metallopeptidase n=1 Tax=Nannocystis sp. SCPEA4 TaxID=2996787 RepID=UPI002271A9DB|nr:M15 family metallopeptidase [Nannocystis sp. SCPEA4]MCY1060341.1 D-alanyl-D-alanine dipeptidase [Nannocystis sp. SCPEA4]
MTSAPAPGGPSPAPADIAATTPRTPADAISAEATSSPVPADTPKLRPPPPGFVDLHAALPGACFAVRYATADNFTGAPLPGYDLPGAWLRERPAAALARAQATLAPEGLTFLVYDAYRPARASLAMVEWAGRSGRRRLVDDGYIARRSGHNRGDTVDLTLARSGSCEPLDMGSPWDHFGPESHFSHQHASGAAMTHRRRLRRALQSAGFTPYDKEWWHFTFHDEGAVPLDVPYAP